MDKAKPFCISKREVWTAYKRADFKPHENRKVHGRLNTSG